MLTFTSIGFSTEDVQIFNKQVVDFSEFPLYERGCILIGAKAVNFKDDAKVEIDNLEESGYEQCDEQDYKDEWKSTVDKFRKLVEEGKGILFSWCVEYDDNLMYVEGMTEKEFVDFVEKEMIKVDEEEQE